MFRLALVCFVAALIAAFLGFAGIAGEFVWVAKVLFFAFLALGGAVLRSARLETKICVVLSLQP